MTVTKPEPDTDLVEEMTGQVTDAALPQADSMMTMPSFKPGPMASLSPTHQPLTQADRLIEMAITSGADIERLDKLLDLKERYDKEEARKLYTAAMASFKGTGLVIKKDQTVTFPHKDGPGETSYKHASLGNIVGLAVPSMAAYGLSHKWECRREGDRIEVRCIVTHSGGHSEATDWWPGPLDSSGKKNAIQQAASTVTYLERYTFLMITGLAVEEQDDDGRKGEDVEEVEMITEDQAMTIHAKITDNDLDMETFLRWLATTAIRAASIEDIPATHFDKVMKKIDATIKAKQAKDPS